MLKTTTYLAAFAITLSVAHAANPAPMKQNYFSIGAVAKGEVESSNATLDVNSGYTLAYGHRIDNNLAIEVAYSHLLDISSQGTNNEINLISLSGLYHLGVGKSRPFVKLGYADSDIETNILDANANDQNNGFLWGLGIDWKINRQTLRLGYNFSDLSDVEYDEFYISALVNF